MFMSLYYIMLNAIFCPFHFVSLLKTYLETLFFSFVTHVYFITPYMYPIMSVFYSLLHYFSHVFYLNFLLRIVQPPIHSFLCTLKRIETCLDIFRPIFFYLIFLQYLILE